MTIHSVKQVSSSRGLRANATGQRFYRRAWLVLADRSDTEATVAAASGIPVVGTAIAHDPSAVAVFAGFTSREVAGAKTLWTVEVDFERPDPERNTRHAPPDPDATSPLDEAARITGSYVRVERFALYDLDDEPVQNSAGDFFAGGLAIEEFDSVVSITRNESTSAFDFAQHREFNGTTNVSEYSGAAADKLLLLIGPWERLWHPVPGFYFRVQYTLHYRKAGWQEAFRDQGLRQKVSLFDPERKPILDYFGRPVSEPVDLDGVGQPLDDDEDPIYLPFRVRDRKDFDELGLDL